MPSLTSRDLRIRMYRVGLGDCFLVSVPADGSHRHILVDFGAHPAGGDIGAMGEVMDDLEAETGKKLAVVVATHEHADHISGFGRFEARLAGFEIGEVWMPWALDADDRRAVERRRSRLALASELQSHFRLAGGGSPLAAHALANLTGNDDAVQALRSGFRGASRTVRYFRADDRVKLPDTLKDLSVKVLGPPDDEEFLKKMDPPASQRYFRLRSSSARQTVTGLEIFAKRWRFENAPRSLLLPKAEERALKDLLAGSLDQLAFSLDSAMNNTSLVLLFAFKGKGLLFPGDAQWGNWKAWLDKSTSTPLLEQVAFLKVAHHGSFNATPKTALEAMTTNGFAAMVSTQSKPWKSHPQPQLMSALERKTNHRILRSDSLPRAGAPAGPKLPSRLPRGFRKDAKSLWLDYVIRV